MPALPLKVQNPHQLLGPIERFLLLLHPRVDHMAKQSGISHIPILLAGWGGPVAPPPLKGGDRGLELQREVILSLDLPSGIGLDLYSGGGDLEAPSDVAALGLLSDQAGPGVEIPREEAGLDQQGEAGHTPGPQLLGADLVLGHQPGGAGLALEHLQGAGHDPEHLPDVGLGLEHQPGGAGLGLGHLLGVDLGPVQYDGGLVVDPQPGEVAGLALEPQPGGAGLAQGPQPGEGDLGLGRQQDGEDPVVEVKLDGEDLTLEHHKEEAGLALRQIGRTNSECHREEAGPTQAQK